MSQTERLLIRLPRTQAFFEWLGELAEEGTLLEMD